MVPTKKSSFEEAIIYLQMLDSKTLLSVDAFTTIRGLNITTLGVEDEHRMSILHQRYSTKILSLSSDGFYLAYITQDAKESKLYDLKNKKTLASIDRHQGNVSCVSIDPKDRYMFSCGDDGGIFGVDIKTAELSLTLPRHLDIVNDIAFSSDGNLVATASYDRNISIFNLVMKSPKAKLKVHPAPVLKVEFIDNNRLFSFDKNNNAYISDINTLRVITKFSEVHDDITQIVIGYKNNFIFFGTKLGYILVYDLNTYGLISRRYIKLEHSITALCFNEETNELIIAAENGELLFYNIFDDEESFSKIIRDKKYDLMLLHVDKNPILKYTKAYIAFEALWKKTLKGAKEFLERNDKVGAAKLFELFNTIPSKRAFAQKFIQEYSEYDKFLMLIKHNKLALAYSLANAHPIYKESKAYKNMEMEWEKTLALAKKYLLDSKLSYKAQEILMPYRGISEKTAPIQELVLNMRVYTRFKASIIQKEFKVSFELIKQNPFLKNYSEYNALIQYSDSLYIRAQMLLNSGDTHGAIKIFRILLDFDDFKNEVKDIILDLESRHRFFNAIEAENLPLAYNILDISPSLKDTEDGVKLQQQWDNDFAQAEIYAKEGNVENIRKILALYMKTRSKNGYIAEIFSTLHLTQIKNAINEKIDQKILENGLKNYLLYYGITEPIKELFILFQAEYPESKLNIDSQVYGVMSRWRPSMAVDAIL
ncbi:WD-40 repeat [Sulfurimonas denitrificans DSM 1251]|uniref:WD-40 repeat n=1 Tax=Sulfurimonas denitrificans (strain ATCC 33889 / DSM 1251) TaxID=326298 RepID=Q30RG1_SULDN|nr:hypothetical protein [Sulfurimonas denitrificans]ABB44420.1 WD-40 repeat [Sulfurimonas denitrificans DSM 1251]MDD3442965.1 hypothetical protein [Sulfurimonas denitrificans]